MPKLTGLDVIKEIKALYANVNRRIQLNVGDAERDVDSISFAEMRIPTFCLFSVHHHKAFVDYTREKGVDYFLEKPPNPDQISRIVRKILEDAG